VRTYLGVDGGGSKTRFLVVDELGVVLAEHREGPAYYLETGLAALGEMLTRGLGTVLKQAGVSAEALSFAFLGLPAYGEDRAVTPQLDTLPAGVLSHRRYRCGNDMVCGWAGALAGADGINIVAGTGSIAYGEFASKSARAGGWGELFSDEGSAYWLAREGLRLFTRMSDGRSPRGPLYALVRGHLALEDDLDLCAAVYGKDLAQRSHFAGLAKLVSAAAAAGDGAARALFTEAARELADIVDAVRTQLGVPAATTLKVSCTGGLFQRGDLLRIPLEAELARRAATYQLTAARLSPGAGAAVHAAKLSGSPLSRSSIETLARHDRATG
jgi:N-acetylglucosamine kinase-like BadF-type ATPase